MHTFTNIGHYFRLCRPVNVLIGMISIFIGAFITGTIQPIRAVLFASISGGLIAAAANSINDYFDIAIDKINKPHRPIAAGHISPTNGFIFSIALFIAGMTFGYFINWKAFVVSVSSAIILFLYSARLKGTVLWGNLCVSLVTSLSFIYGGIAVNRLNLALIPAVFSFFYHLGREIIKDVEDVKGDRADHIKTLPIQYGSKLALEIATWVYVLLIFLTIAPYVFNIFGIYYLAIVVGVVDVVIVVALVSIWKNQEIGNLSRMSFLLKLNMFAGLIAIYCGKF
ncbi:MAG: geranylgeranylglycerol-phosphate geranylgeranyltransferase [Candidatus Zhuqueibacterota bacterium]